MPKHRTRAPGPQSERQAHDVPGDRPSLVGDNPLRGAGRYQSLARWLEHLPAWSIPAVVFAVALALRLGIQWLVGFYDNPLRWEYDVVARNVAEGRGYYYDFLGTRWLTWGLPALPLLDAALYKVSGGTDRYLAIGLAHASLSAGTVALGTLVAMRLAGRVAGAIAGGLMAFHPGALLYASQIQELPLETFALAIALVAFLTELRAPSRTSLIAAAFAATLVTFVRPTYGAFVAAALAVLIARSRGGAWKRAVVIALAVVLATLPWTIRTSLAVGGERVGLGPYGCKTIWQGNNPYSSGSSIASDGRSWWDVQPADVQARIYGQTEVEQGRIMCEQAAAFLFTDPIRSVGWWMTKWSWYWWTSPQQGQFYPSVSLRVYLALWAAAAMLAFVGGTALWRSGRGWEVTMLLALILPISLAQSAAYVDGRHRIEVEWVVLILGSVGIVALLRRGSSLAVRPPWK